MKLHHYTVNTGHTATTTREEVIDQTIEFLRPIVAREGGPLTLPDPGNLDIWWIDIWRPFAVGGSALPGAAVFQVARGPAGTDEGARPFVMAVACWDQDRARDAWQQLGAIAQTTAGVPDVPGEAPAAPFLAVVLMPHIGTLTPGQAGVLGDLERCLFWTLAEEAPDAS